MPLVKLSTGDSPRRAHNFGGMLRRAGEEFLLPARDLCFGVTFAGLSPPSSKSSIVSSSPAGPRERRVVAFCVVAILVVGRVVAASTGSNSYTLAPRNCTFSDQPACSTISRRQLGCSKPCG